MDWRQIHALHAAGMNGSTLTHRPPSTLTDDELRADYTSRRVLEEALGAGDVHFISHGFFNPHARHSARGRLQSLGFGHRLSNQGTPSRSSAWR
jgi:hypothetical protein